MINDLKDLKALFKLCRAQGVTDFKMGEIEIKLGELPNPKAQAQYVPEDEIAAVRDPYADFPTGMLTPDQLAFYSAGGNPEDDPLNKEAI